MTRRLRFILPLFLGLFLLQQPSQAVDTKDKGVRLSYGVGFATNFDNREYSSQSQNPSETLFGARLSPSVGLILSERQARQTINIGADFFKSFGDNSSSPTSSLEEILLNYSLYKPGRSCDISLHAGIFSRKEMLEGWSTAFFSEKYLWTDPNIEGILLKLNSRTAAFELGCDWMGQYGSSYDTREQFLLFTSGALNLGSLFQLGYNAYMMHYACSQQTIGVVDNILTEPWVKLRSEYLDFKLGYFVSAQRDRNIQEELSLSGLFDLGIDARWRCFGLSNNFYLGGDLMPLFGQQDNSGQQYGTHLYLNDPFFNISNFPGFNYGSYDRCELYWQPVISSRLNLKISAIFHFHNNSFTGSQQIVSLVLDI